MVGRKAGLVAGCGCWRLLIVQVCVSLPDKWSTSCRLVLKCVPVWQCDSPQWSNSYSELQLVINKRGMQPCQWERLIKYLREAVYWQSSSQYYQDWTPAILLHSVPLPSLIIILSGFLSKLNYNFWIILYSPASKPHFPPGMKLYQQWIINFLCENQPGFTEKKELNRTHFLLLKIK